MSRATQYKEYLELREKTFSKPTGKYYIHQEKRYVKPFRIYGNVYYVGDDFVCVHLIDTGEGLLLIDSGNSGATAMLVQAIWEMGFRPNDVKWMILSHGHVDHIGGAEFFRDMYGTKLYLGAPDAKMFKERPEYSFIYSSPDITNDVFSPDACIEDGDVLTFGNVSIKCYLVPGHTEGCVALFFDAQEENEAKRCGYYGGFGFNTLRRESLEEWGDPEYRRWKTYEESIDKVINEPVDIFLGNHTENNRTVEKIALIKEHPETNPFIDPSEWKIYLAHMKEELHKFIKKEMAASPKK